MVLRAPTALGKVLKGIPAAEERIEMVKELLLLPLSRLVISIIYPYEGGKKAIFIHPKFSKLK